MQHPHGLMPGACPCACLGCRRQCARRLSTSRSTSILVGRSRRSKQPGAGRRSDTRGALPKPQQRLFRRRCRARAARTSVSRWRRAHRARDQARPPTHGPLRGMPADGTTDGRPSRSRSRSGLRPAPAPDGRAASLARAGGSESTEPCGCKSCMHQGRGVRLQHPASGSRCTPAHHRGRRCCGRARSRARSRAGGGRGRDWR